MGGKHDLYEKRMPENPIAIVQQGSHLLDRAWAQINSLGCTVGNDSYRVGYSTALNQALSIIELLSGKDPLKRKHDRGES